MAYDKKTFLKEVTILHDTREQENLHILDKFDEMKVKHQEKGLVFGDYSFIIQDRDFSLSCVIERKANVDELYGNLTQDRERIEREFQAGSTVANEFTLLVENVANIDDLQAYEVPDWMMEKFKRKVKNIGEYCYSTIQSWQSGNRYKFRTIFVANKKDTAIKMLECFYWYWRNFKTITASRRNRK